MPLEPTFSNLTYTCEPESFSWTSGGIFANNRQEWKWNGFLHSVDDHPAVVIEELDEKQWYKHGQRHRAEHLGPAWSKGTPYWDAYYNSGVLHRVNGPAMINPHVEKWYQFNERHRADGPAVEHVNGTKEWWLSGRHFNKLDDWLTYNKTISDDMKLMIKITYG
jgi:hypothetical protein